MAGDKSLVGGLASGQAPVYNVPSANLSQAESSINPNVPTTNVSTGVVTGGVSGVVSGGVIAPINTIKLDDGTYVDQSSFNTLSSTDQALLKKLGVAGFNAQQTAANQVFLANNVKLDDGTYVALADFNKLSATDQASLKSLGVAGFNAQQTAANQAVQQTFLANNVKLNDGSYVSLTAFNSLSPADQASLKSLGVVGFNAQQVQANQIAQQTFLTQNTPIAGGQYVSNSFYNELTPTAQAILKSQGIDAFNKWLQGTPTTTQVQVAGTTTPDNDPNHQMAEVTYNDGSTATMQALAVQAMAAEGGLQAWSIVSWTPIPTPPIVTPPTTQTVTSTVAPSLAQVYTDSGWKPDFTSSTPYAGMPSWYQQVESAGFVPSPANGVNPPSQAYVPLAAGVTYPTNVGQTAFTAMQANPATAIQGAVYQGYNPITGQISYNSNTPPANSVKLSDGSYVSNAYYGTLSPTDQIKLFNEGIGVFLGTANIGLTPSVLAQMKQNDPAEYQQYMQDILTMGNTAAAQAHLTLINNAIAAINTQVTVPVSTSGVYNFDTWATGLTAGLTVGNNPAYVQAKTNQALYQDAGGGLKGYQAVVQSQVGSFNTYLQDVYTKTYNADIQSGKDNVTASQDGLNAVNASQTTALQQLTNQGYINSDGSVNWTKVTKDGIDTTVLVQAGFTPAEISGQFGSRPT